MRIPFAATVFGLAVLVVACGGGGTSGVVPPQAPGQPPVSGAKARLTVVLKIPPATQQSHARKPFFVSPNTQSIAFAVVPSGSGTPTPAQAQIFPIATPSPCATVAGVETCTFDVQAPFGTDTFYVATFNVPVPTASNIPLATFISGAIAVASPVPGVTPSPLAFVMNGIINSVAITVPSPDPSNTPDTQVFTVGVAASAQPLGITPYDVSGAPILSDAFDAPLVLNVTPANSGITLAIHATCPGSSGSGSTIQIGCAADLTNVTFAYDGSVIPDASDRIVDTFAVSASQIASPAPSPAHVVLQSNVATYPINPGAYTYHSVLLQALPNNVVAYVLTGDASNVGQYGTVSASTGVQSTPVMLNGTTPQGFYAMSDGSIWITDSTNNTLSCFGPSGGSALQTIPFAPHYGSTGLTFDGTNLWWTEYASTPSYVNYAYYAPVTSTCGLGAINSYALPSDIYGDGGMLMTPLAGGGVAIDGVGTGGFWTVTSSGGATYVNPGFVAGYAFGGGVATDAAGTIYAAFNNYCALPCNQANILTIPSGGSSFNQFVNVPVLRFGSLAAFSPSGGAADRLAFADTTHNALGLVGNANTASPSPLLVSFPDANLYAVGSKVAFTTQGAPLVGYQNVSTTALGIGVALPTTTWSVPVTYLSMTAMLTIDERGDSGPFTVTPVGTPPTCYKSIAPLAGTDHAFIVGTIYSTGTCPITVLIKDKNGRAQTVNLIVTENAG